MRLAPENYGRPVMEKSVLFRCCLRHQRRGRYWGLSHRHLCLYSVVSVFFSFFSFCQKKKERLSFLGQRRVLISRRHNFHGPIAVVYAIVGPERGKAKEGRRKGLE